ncbi:MAG: aminotransferase class IV [Candidatus Margulisbacteria bacterium]|nr:aminotransferase class IV [Candidatus Margulisiibacteriota bacterium]
MHFKLSIIIMNEVLQYIAFNLEIVSKETLSFPFEDPGYLLGTGLFETVLIENGQPVLLDDHVDRMKKSADAFKLEFPYTLRDVGKMVSNLILQNNVKRARMNGYLTPGSHKPNLMMMLRSLPDNYHEETLTVELKQETVPSSWLNEHKTKGYIKAYVERLGMKTDDVILYDSDGFILEASYANVFFAKGETLYTPPVHHILPGVTRQWILDQQKQLQVEVVEEKIHKDTLETYDEVFLTSSTRLIGIVSEIVGQELRSKTLTKQIKDRVLLKLSENGLAALH